MAKFFFQNNGKKLGGGGLTYLVWSFPFVLKNNLERTFYLIYQNADWFPLLSLRAYNLWWLVAGGKGMEISDKILTLGITSAKTMGLILFSSFYLLAVGLVLEEKGLKNLLLAFVVAGLDFFLFPTQNHEHYIFPAFCFLFFFYQTTGKNQKKSVWL